MEFSLNTSVFIPTDLLEAVELSVYIKMFFIIFSSFLGLVQGLNGGKNNPSLLVWKATRWIYSVNRTSLHIQSKQSLNLLLQLLFSDLYIFPHCKFIFFLFPVWWLWLLGEKPQQLFYWNHNRFFLIEWERSCRWGWNEWSFD